MQPQPTRKTSEAGIVKKPSLYWCEAVQSKSGSKGLKTVSAQTDQTRVSPHPAGSSEVGFTKSHWLQTYETPRPGSERGVPQKI